MDFENAVKYINSRLNYGIKPGLERISELLSRIGDPPKSLKFVHVAGTNGKGSVSAMIAASASCAGYKTGLFTSPYISDFCDRMTIDGEMIPHDELAQITSDISVEVEKMDEDDKHITEFELITAIAFEWFKREKCDLVVLEAGLGGLEDSTNVIAPPEIAILTKIALDHMNILGSTIGQITEQKCGIIKNGTTVVSYPMQEVEALEVIFRHVAEKCGRVIMGNPNPGIISSSLHGNVMEYGDDIYEISMCGVHQTMNAITAIEAVNALNSKGWRIDRDSLKKGIKNAVLPARLEVISHSPTVILDGSHNVNGITALSEFLKNNLADKRINAVVGMLADKQVNEAMSIISPLFNRITTVTPKNPRAMDAKALCELISQYNKNVTAFERVTEAVNEAEIGCDALIVFGSLYLSGEIRQYLLEKY